MNYDKLVEELEEKQTKIEADIKKTLSKYVSIQSAELDLGSLMMGEPFIHVHCELKEEENTND